MRRTALAAATVGIALIVTGCSSSSTTSTPPPATGAAPAGAASSPASPPSAPAAAPQQSSGAPTGAGAGGLPPKPDAATTAAYLAALDAIDKDIVHGKADTAVSRGRDQCSSIGQHKSQEELVQLAIKRFSSPTHPQGFGPEKAAKIVDAVHTHLCPTF